MIPGPDFHPPTSNGAYNPQSPAQYAPEEPTPSDYPVTANTGVQVGVDPLNNELAAVYGTSGTNIGQFYATHWLLDVDNMACCPNRFLAITMCAWFHLFHLSKWCFAERSPNMTAGRPHGFGQKETGSGNNVFLNTFQRGSNESVWRTVPQPEWEIMKYGETTGNQGGFLDLFLADPADTR